MDQASRVPANLMRRPFTLSEAHSAGISRKRLSGKSWRRIARGLYCWTGWRADHLQLMNGWKGLLPEETIFGGRSAAWLWGLDVNPVDPVEVILPASSGIRSRTGLKVRYNVMEDDDHARVRGLRATTLSRTLRDLCVHITPVEALCVIDMAVAARRTDPRALVDYADSVRGRPGSWRLRQLAQVAAAADSPMETRLRWLLLSAGLPRPDVQRDLRDADGRFVGRADLFYEAARLAIEYDGGHHRDQLTQDNRRQNVMVNAGFRLLRFTAADLDRPEILTFQVRRALRLGDALRKAPPI